MSFLPSLACTPTECDKLRRDGYRSSQYYSQGPTFAANSGPLCDDYQDEDEETDQKVSLLFLFLLSFIFSGPNLWHMEVPRLGV